jgi:hypothetical protein
VARHLAHLKQSAPALKVMQRVVDGGYFCYPMLARDPWLDPLRKKARFAALLEQAAAQHGVAQEKFERLGGPKVLGA